MLKHIGDESWREVILLTAGNLSTENKTEATRLIQAIANHKKEPKPLHNLLLSAECIRDIRYTQIANNHPALRDIQGRLRQELAKPPSFLVRWHQKLNIGYQTNSTSRLARWLKRFETEEWLEQKQRIVTAWVQTGAGYWVESFGEPEWVTISTNKSVTKSGDILSSQNVDPFQISRVPITNIQYYLFVRDCEYEPPSHWENGLLPREQASHPVVYVTWDDAYAYCQWLSNKTGKQIRLPTEDEWKLAARGSQDTRVYPWGNSFDQLRCNTSELGLGQTTPVGIFPTGASPYGLLDMSGNVWEWTGSWFDENQTKRVVLGGSWKHSHQDARISIRYHLFPNSRERYFGFRVVTPSESDA